MCRKNDALRRVRSAAELRSGDTRRVAGARPPTAGPRYATAGHSTRAATFHPWCTQRCCAGATETGHVPLAAVALSWSCCLVGSPGRDLTVLWVHGTAGPGRRSGRAGADALRGENVGSGGAGGA